MSPHLPFHFETMLLAAYVRETSNLIMENVLDTVVLALVEHSIQWMFIVQSLLGMSWLVSGLFLPL
jgi:hypothetical protein